MPQSAQGQAAQSQTQGNAGGVQTSIQYRFRVGNAVSGWMTAEQLKDAALRGDLLPEGEVQQSGHADWVVASHVRGLAFPAPVTEAAPVVETTGTHAGLIANGAARQPRFGTFRDLFGLYLNADIEVNLPDSSEYSPAKLCAAGVDHFEVSLESSRSRVFLPYSRIQAVWVTETSTNATLTYRDSHRLTIEVQPTKR
ncbi:MAG: hypothetical protein JNL80_06125 [Phycisphaerae bacterium]|jgi:hypothetical protein|nr:hypothetical protein [Phycisphaerae bacterium]